MCPSLAQKHPCPKVFVNRKRVQGETKTKSARITGRLC